LQTGRQVVVRLVATRPAEPPAARVDARDRLDTARRTAHRRARATSTRVTTMSTTQTVIPPRTKPSPNPVVSHRATASCIEPF
jgi:hypothetical protein